MTPALRLAITAPPHAPSAVRCIGPATPAAATAAGLATLGRALAVACGARARVLVRGLGRVPAVEAPGEPSLGDLLVGPGLPELDAITRWYHAHAHLVRHRDPGLGRLADEMVTLRCLMRDVEHTAGCLAPGGQPGLALAIAWLTDLEGEVEAVLSYTDRAALSFARRGRVPYVYNVWSRAAGRGGELLRFVAWQAGGRPITLHPLHDGLAAHYVRAYEAQPAD
jgi:hypothetical protein